MAEESLDEWTVKANDVMNITLFAKAEKDQKEVNPLCTFQPTWTYPIVGDKETISGYKGLKIYLRYNASDMRPHLFHTSTARLSSELTDSDEYEVHDVKDLFETHLPPGQYQPRLQPLKC